MFYQKYGSQIFRNTKNKQLSSY
ncbi:hypothetical protein HMPREF9735_00916, partial [Treponema denticola ATCC 33521]